MTLSATQKMQIDKLASNSDLSHAEIARAVGVRKIHVSQYLDIEAQAEYFALKREQERRERFEAFAKAKRQKEADAAQKKPVKPRQRTSVTRCGQRIVTVEKYKMTESTITPGKRVSHISLPRLSFLEGET